MQAVVLEAPGRLVLRAAPRPAAPPAGYARVRVLAVGICGTDLHAYEGRQTFFTYPRVLGHELAVEVVEIGRGVTRLQPGMRCAVEPYLYCGGCIACRRGKTNCCEQLCVLGVHVDGGMQEELLIPAQNLHPCVELTAEELVLVEPLCIGVHAVRRAQLGAEDTVAILGAGPIGLAVAEAVRLAGADPLLVEVAPSRIRLCERFFGKNRCISGSDQVAEKLRERFNGELPTVVFDCTGNVKSMERAFEYVAAGGKLILVGHYPGEIRFSDPLFHGRELTLYATRNATAEDFRYVLEQLRSKRIQAVRWITDRLNLHELVSRFSEFLQPNGQRLKVIVKFAEEATEDEPTQNAKTLPPEDSSPERGVS